jgi:hypothetical protein
MSIAAHDLCLLEHLMREEAETLEALSALEDRLRRLVMDRDWNALDGMLREVQAAGEKVSKTDLIRAAVYQKIRMSCQARPEDGFQEILARVPACQRETLSALHGRVRAAVERVKCLTGGLDTYINSAMSTMDKMLEEIFPDRKNRIYPRGGGLQDSGRPVMISRSL